jgi:hypothetical protein
MPLWNPAAPAAQVARVLTTGTVVVDGIVVTGMGMVVVVVLVVRAAVPLREEHPASNPKTAMAAAITSALRTPGR